jgi:glycosyltransferase involved in cell wall biosynthesis
MFSIIIPARIGNEILKKTIKNCLNQSYPDFEILVILDFESDNLVQDSKIRYIFSGIKSPGEKRNLGIEKSLGNYIAFLDDDAFPDIDWLKNAKELFDANQDYIGVCGPSITPPESDFLEKIGGYIFESSLTSGPTRFRHVPSKHRFVDDYPTVNLILRKEVLSAVGGFDNNYWPGEDTKLCHDITIKYGKKIYYSPLLIVYHKRRTIYSPHLIQISRYAAHRGYFAKKFPETSFKLSYFIPSIFMLYILLIPLMLFFVPKIINLYLLPFYLYIFLVGIDMIRVYSRSSSFAACLLTAIGILISNLSYGIFFIKGLLSKPELVLREVDFINEKYLKG